MSTATAVRSKRHRTTRPAASTDRPRFDPYQEVTDQIIALLESGTAPWHKPWDAANGGMPRSLSTGKPYRGINPFLLQMAAIAHGYASPWWATYDNIASRGGQVRKGEKGTMVIFWKQYVRKGTEVGEDDRPAFVARAFKVFNTDQADGLTLPPIAGRPVDSVDPIAACDAAIAGYLATGPTVHHGGNRACYWPGADAINMPERDTFDGSEEYYGTLFHESVHSTGHKKRLARPDLLNMHAFGDVSYSKEELVAELGSAFLSGHTGITVVTLPNSAAYLASWIKVLRGDHKLLIQAAGQAQKAADLILGITYDTE